eukprot:g18823.t1
MPARTFVRGGEPVVVTTQRYKKFAFTDAELPALVQEAARKMKDTALRRFPQPSVRGRNYPVRGNGPTARAVAASARKRAYNFCNRGSTTRLPLTLWGMKFVAMHLMRNTLPHLIWTMKHIDYVHRGRLPANRLARHLTPPERRVWQSACRELRRRFDFPFRKSMQAHRFWLRFKFIPNLILCMRK